MKTHAILGLSLLLVLSGCVTIDKTPPVNDKYCNSLDDCACGKKIGTGECFFGNKQFVNVQDQCPDFCTGIAGNFELKCISNKCELVNKLNEKYCDVDSDCVRKNSCCDCGLGNYINKKFQEAVECEGPRCLCAVMDSTGKCVNHQCIAVPKIEGFCGTSTFGSCSSSNDCVKGGCSSQVCQSKSEKPVITTCEYAECYDPKPYNLDCKCVESMCQWWF